MSIVYNEFGDGLESQRLEASGPVAGGQFVRLIDVFVLANGSGAATVTWYEDADAGTPATKRGGHTGAGASVWTREPGIRQALSQLYIDFTANTAEVIVTFHRL